MELHKIAPHTDEVLPLQGRTAEYVQKLNENPPGLQDNVHKLSETPEAMMKRVLLVGEQVLADFDCYFPFRMLPLWKIILFCFFTGGLYLFVLLYRVIQRYFYRIKCCTPKHMEFTRGKVTFSSLESLTLIYSLLKKMIVTSKGRIICWKLEADQLKQDGGGCFHWCCKLCFQYYCSAPIVYHVSNVTEAFRVENIREVALHYLSHGLCFCLGNTYTAGVKVVFHQYDHNGKVQDSFVSTTSLRAYFDGVTEKLGSYLEKGATTIESALNLSSRSEVLYVCSSTGDAMHLNNQFGLVENLMNLYTRFLSVLPKSKFPDIVVGNGDYSEVLGSKSIQFSDDIAGIRMVYDDGKITLPKEWLPLLPQECIIAATGQTYTMTKMEWIRAILSLGLYYVFHIRKRKFLRSAIILTNKRIIAIDIYQRAGIIPHNLVNFTLQYTSYFPLEIRSGYMTSLNKHWLEMGLETAGGNILFELFDHQRSLPFAKAVQLATTRELPCPQVFCPPDNVTIHHNPLKVLSEDDILLLPLLPGEVVFEVINNVKGSNHITFVPFCYTHRFPQKIICCGKCTKENFPFCSKHTNPCLFPWLTYLCTCALRPFVQQQYIIITNQSILTFTRHGNYGICGFLCPNVPKSTESSSMIPCCIGPCVKRDHFMIAWVSIYDYLGHSLKLSTAGNENCPRRVFDSCGCRLCARICCPLNANSFHLGLHMKNSFLFSVSSHKKNHFYVEDEGLLEVTRTLDGIEAGLYETVVMERD